MFHLNNFTERTYAPTYTQASANDLMEQNGFKVI